MNTAIWEKYLPILRIVFKRSLAAEQTFALNAPDFERAGFKRKSGYKFLIILKDGRLDNVVIDQPLASGLASALLNDKVIKELATENEIHVSMNSKYGLTIKNVSQSEKVQTAETIEAIG
jgi:hypothetical protein